MDDSSRTYPMSEASVVWDSVKLDGSLHRSAQAIDLGATDEGRWLSIPAGTPVTQSHGRGYHHPCDAVALIPPEGLWTATWLVEWDPTLYVDIELSEAGATCPPTPRATGGPIARHSPASSPPPASPTSPFRDCHEVVRDGVHYPLLLAVCSASALTERP